MIVGFCGTRGADTVGHRRERLSDTTSSRSRARRSSEAHRRVAFALTLRHLELGLTGKEA